MNILSRYSVLMLSLTAHCVLRQTHLLMLLIQRHCQLPNSIMAYAHAYDLGFFPHRLVADRYRGLLPDSEAISQLAQIVCGWLFQMRFWHDSHEFSWLMSHHRAANL